VGRLVEWENRINHRFEFTIGRPLQSGLQIGAISSVAANEALLLNKKRPDIELNLAPGGRAAGHNRATASQTFKTLYQNLAANVFEDYVDAMALRNFAHFSRPLRIVGLDDEFSPKMVI